MKLMYAMRSFLWSKVRPPVQGRHTTLLRIHRWSPNLGGIYPSQRRTMNYFNSDQLPDPHHIRTDGLVHRMRPKPWSFSIPWLTQKLWLPLWSKSHNLRCEIYWSSHAPIDPIHRLESMNWINSDQPFDPLWITFDESVHRMKPGPRSLSGPPVIARSLLKRNSSISSPTRLISLQWVFNSASKASMAWVTTEVVSI